MRKPEDVLEKAEAEREELEGHIRDAAEWFHDREGKVFERPEAQGFIADKLDIDHSVAGQLIGELVGDTVDPVIQIPVENGRYVGIIDYVEFDVAYGYVDYHDRLGKRKRVVCAQCVHTSTYDTEVTHATGGDPQGSFDRNADYDDLYAAVKEHFENAHDVPPSTVETGASLASGTTIGGNTSWHAGNDGSGSGLAADHVDGHNVYVQSSEPSGASDGDIWLDTS